MNPEDQRKRLLLSRIQHTIWSHTVTIRVSRIVDLKEESWNTASGILLALGQRLFVVTAFHVVEKFVEIRDDGDIPILIVGNAPMSHLGQVFLDERNDVIVLDVTGQFPEALNAVPYHPSRQWPPPRVVEGDTVFVCGFPALLRSAGEEIEHGDLSYLGEVESASEFQFVLQLHGELEDAGRVPFPELSVDLGGLSGCPAFVLYSDHMQLAGIFSQAAVSAPVWILKSLAHLPVDLADLFAKPV